MPLLRDPADLSDRRHGASQRCSVCDLEPKTYRAGARTLFNFAPPATDSLETTSAPKIREVEATKAKLRSLKRFST